MGHPIRRCTSRPQAFLHVLRRKLAVTYDTVHRITLTAKNKDTSTVATDLRQKK